MVELCTYCLFTVLLEHLVQLVWKLQIELERLKLEVKQTMEMYKNACKEAVSAQKKVCSDYVCTSIRAFDRFLKDLAFAYIFSDTT